MRGMGDGRAEHDCLSPGSSGPCLLRLLLPVPDHFVGDRRAVHDRGHFAHVEIRQRFAHRAQLVLHADVDDESARRHQMARGDQLTQTHLIGDIVEHLAQALAVAPVRRGGDAEDPGIRIGIADMVDDAAVTCRHRMMRLVDHQQIKLRHGGEIADPRQRRHHGEGHLTRP